MLWSAREVNWPGERWMTLFALLHASGGTTEVGIAALHRGAVNFEFLWRVLFAFAVTCGLVGEPRAIPSGGTTPERIVMDSFRTRQITLFVAVEADPDWTVATAGPRVEDAPTTIVADVFAASGWVCRGRLTRGR